MDKYIFPYICCEVEVRVILRQDSGLRWDRYLGIGANKQNKHYEIVNESSMQLLIPMISMSFALFLLPVFKAQNELALT